MHGEWPVPLCLLISSLQHPSHNINLDVGSEMVSHFLTVYFSLGNVPSELLMALPRFTGNYLFSLFPFIPETFSASS